MWFKRRNNQSEQPVNQAEQTNNYHVKGLNNRVVYRTPANMQVYTPFLTLASENHLMIAGCTGSGKSVAVNGIITSLIMMNSPYDVQFVLIDPKRVELSSFSTLPHCIKYADNQKDIIHALKMSEIEMEKRFKAMKTSGHKEYRGSHLYIIIDELADIMTTCKKECFPMLQRIAQLGRAAKVHLIACTQCLLAKIVPTELKCNFPVILGLRTANRQQSNFLINSYGLEALPDPKTAGKGEGIVRDGADLFPIEIYKYPDAAIESVIKYWTSNACIA